MPCDIATAKVAALPSIGAVGLCHGDCDLLFQLALASMAIAKSSDHRAGDPTAVECLEVALIAISELLDFGFTREARQ